MAEQSVADTIADAIYVHCRTCKTCWQEEADSECVCVDGAPRYEDWTCLTQVFAPTDIQRLRAVLALLTAVEAEPELYEIEKDGFQVARASAHGHNVIFRRLRAVIAKAEKEVAP